MNPKKIKSPGINVGTSLILVAFVLLCLVAFAALSYSTAESDYRLSLQTMERKESYYSACNTAERQLQQLDTLFRSCYASASDETDYYSSIVSALSDKTGCTVTTDTKTPVISYSVPINKKESLHVTLRTCYPDTETGSDALFTIISYRTQSDSNTPDENTIQQNGGLLF